MKFTRFFTLALGMFGCLSSLNSQTPTNSTISEAYVYMGSARVTRLADAQLESGENSLRFVNLPTHLDVNQIQVGLQDGVPIRLDNLKFQQVKDRDESAEEKRLKDAVEEKRDEIRLLNSEKGDQSRRVLFASSLSKSFTDGFGESDLDLDSLKRAEEVLDFQQQTTVGAQSRIREIDDQLAESEEELKELLEDLAEATRKAEGLQGELIVRLYAAEAGAASLVFNYLVPSANWYPSYAVRVDSADRGMELVYQANIWQNSGETWDDVVVTVSTSQPSRSGNVPELGPVYLQPNQYGIRQSMARAAPAAEPLLKVSSFEMAKDEAYNAETSVQAGMSSFSATLPTKVTLDSESDPSRFPILTEDFQSDFWSEAVPLLQEKGFLKSKTTNVFDLPLMPGQAQVYIDGKLTSRISVPYGLPGDELELSLGVDEFIVVNRKETLRATEYAGLIDKTTVLQRAYTIEISNFHPTGHRVKVYDRFPISRNEKIVVKRKLPDKSVVEIEEDTGVFFWEENLRANQEKEYQVAFEVVHPREWHLDDQI